MQNLLDFILAHSFWAFFEHRHNNEETNIDLSTDFETALIHTHYKFGKENICLCN